MFALCVTLGLTFKKLQQLMSHDTEQRNLAQRMAQSPGNSAPGVYATVAAARFSIALGFDAIS